jgi:hypothetical protein
MAARRLILAMIALLVLSSAAAALVPVERDGTESSTTESTTTTSPSPTGKLRHEKISAAAKEPQTVKVTAGDELALTVKVPPPVADQVEIPAFGELEDVDQYTPARFDLLLDDPGRYAVRLVEAHERVAWIVVRKRGKAQDEPRSSDSPGESTSGDTPGASPAS